MAGFVGVRGHARSSSGVGCFFVVRKARAKMETLFSLEMIVFLAALLFIMSIMFLNAYTKSIVHGQAITIREKIDSNRELNLMKKDYESSYIEKISPAALMKKAENEDFKVASKEKILSF